MFVDASALTAIIVDEDDVKMLQHKLDGERRRITSPIALRETAAAVARIKNVSVDDAAAEVHRYGAALNIDMMTSVRQKPPKPCAPTRDTGRKAPIPRD